MPRSRRVSPDGFVQHVVNRGDHRETIFHKPSDFRAFLAVIAEAAYRIPIRILAYCIMRNHFHLVLWPYEGKDLPVFMQQLMNTHINRYLRHYPPSSRGHIYQGRYANSLVETGPALLRVTRYVEANALSAGLVKRAEHYKWSSASPHARDEGRPALAEWPIARPANWLQYVNTPTPADEWKKLQRSVRCGAPYGSDDWVTTVAATHALQSTLRQRGRPRVYETVVLTE
jgi:REP-associated tyrosine transposase